ncbi:MAG: hypothetical protein UW78_C0012G0005 [Candidatus Azambacteria bacterium GW2011_GWA1_44_9]|uniref:Uncharacterized protein n=1 Tax=Candidatus Azambacteria bacterium GW2011_GWA1_44_9 TaxID=1618610 RepID=A0A0G1KCK2_9BACT|nr:MAG: hypothetical protein UW78_C0012G0005 [Candidatus Azambacteria bacterium GW2011_GWA1_44_9]
MVEERIVKELQQIIKDSYGKDLTYQEASKMADTLVGYWDLLAKIYHETTESGKQNRK